MAELVSYSTVVRSIQNKVTFSPQTSATGVRPFGVCLCPAEYYCIQNEQSSFPGNAIMQSPLRARMCAYVMNYSKGKPISGTTRKGI